MAAKKVRYKDYVGENDCWHYHTVYTEDGRHILVFDPVIMWGKPCWMRVPLSLQVQTIGRGYRNKEASNGVSY